ncbi:MAG: caspase family protein [Blastocatellia bacterium]
MKRCAVVIGVNKTGDLPVLNAAASGADDFAKWATQQGIVVTLLTDANSGSVTLSDIKKAIRAYVQQRTFDQLIVFFSGHGILRRTRL